MPTSGTIYAQLDAVKLGQPANSPSEQRRSSRSSWCLTSTQKPKPPEEHNFENVDHIFALNCPGLGPALA
jgi:hypothetical protein